MKSPLAAQHAVIRNVSGWTAPVWQNRMAARMISDLSAQMARFGVLPDPLCGHVKVTSWAIFGVS